MRLLLQLDEKSGPLPVFQPHQRKHMNEHADITVHEQGDWLRFSCVDLGSCILAIQEVDDPCLAAMDHVMEASVGDLQRTSSSRWIQKTLHGLCSALNSIRSMVLLILSLGCDGKLVSKVGRT